MLLNDPASVGEIAGLFERYEAALAANDIQTLTAFFWNSTLAVRYGIGECLYGHRAIADFRYARIGGSPARKLERAQITVFGSDVAVVNAEFRRNGEPRCGRQSQTWVRFPEGWRIVAAHVSLQAEHS